MLEVVPWVSLRLIYISVFLCLIAFGYSLVYPISSANSVYVFHDHLFDKEYLDGIMREESYAEEGKTSDSRHQRKDL